MSWVLMETNFRDIGKLSRGKVRDIYDPGGNYFYMVATDRISAFDSVLPAGIPHKGFILTQISRFCFTKLNDIAENHYMISLDPNVMAVRKLKGYPVEVVVRGYLMGSAWRAYENGQRDFNGTVLPDGLKENQALDEAIVTPTTKAEAGTHDEDITDQKIVEGKLVPADMWKRIKSMSVELYLAGNELAKRNGGVVFDTKFEWGCSENSPAVLMDEVFTPDSSRIGEIDSYVKNFAAGKRPEWFDKEYGRDWLKEQGWMGIQDGEIPKIPDEVVREVSRRYQRCYEIMTGMEFRLPEEPPTAERIMNNIRRVKL